MAWVRCFSPSIGLFEESYAWKLSLSFILSHDDVSSPNTIHTHHPASPSWVFSLETYSHIEAWLTLPLRLRIISKPHSRVCLMLATPERGFYQRHSFCHSTTLAEGKALQRDAVNSAFRISWFERHSSVFVTSPAGWLSIRDSPRCWLIGILSLPFKNK